MRKLLLTLLAIGFGCSISNLMAQTPLSPEKLWELGRIGAPVIDNNNGYVFYTIKRYDMSKNSGQAQIYRSDLKGKKIEAITSVEEGIGNIIINPSNGKVGYVYQSQLWEMNTDGSDAAQVTDFSFPISNVKYSPNGDRILFTYSIRIGENPPHADLDKSDFKIYDDLMFRHWSSWNDNSHSHAAYAALSEAKNGNGMIDIMEDEPFDVPTKPFGGSEDLIWGPNGNSIIYQCKKLNGFEYAASTNSDLYMYDLESKETKNITSKNQGYDTSPVLSKDGKTLVYLSMKRNGYESDKNNLMLYSFETETRVNLTATRDITVSGFAFANEKNVIWISSPNNGTYKIWKLTHDGATAKTVEMITTDAMDYRSVMTLGKELIVSGMSMNRATEYYILDPESKKKRALTHVNDDHYKAISKSKVESRMIKTTDGKEMLTWVIYPPDFDSTKKYPTILYCQGGPQSMVSQFYSFRWNFQLMAAKGYIIVAPNRRGLPGFGQAWNEKISKDWGGQSIQDYLSAIDEVAKEPYVDNSRLGAIGASYGGYSVYYLAGVHNKRFKTFISHCGLFNLESWYGSTEELFFANFDIGGPYWKVPKPKSYDAFSPHKKVQNWDTPLMVIHGGKDFRVPETQGMEAYTAARSLGLKSRFLYFPEESHWVLSPQNGLVWHREFFKWLEETL